MSRRKPGPAPKDGPKAVSTPMSLYPVDRIAIRWWARQQESESDSAALREMIDRAMSLALGADWANKVKDAA